MKPEQSANYFKEFTKISKEITCTLQNTQNQNDASHIEEAPIDRESELLTANSVKQPIP